MKNFVKSSWTVTSCLPGTLLLALIFCSQASWIEAQSLCTAGMAGGFPCSNVDLLARVKMSTLGGTRGSDIWGWTDPTTGTEYAIMGFKQGTSFVDISTPTAPFVVGTLPPHSDPRQARDIKVYSDHAFIVSDTSDHGMQVFDLTQLRTATPGTTFTNTAHYDGFGHAHNLAINEDTGFAYAVGTETCSGGLHMIDIQVPTGPVFAGCFSDDGYTHDAQCVLYNGPDTTYVGREICLNSNEDTVTIVDVTDKAAPVQLAREGYSGRGYVHQGWLTEDHEYFLMDDELDEKRFAHTTRTYSWDVRDLDNPFISGIYSSSVNATDHNLYTKGDYVYESNYRSGVRVLDTSLVASGILTEVAFFDTDPKIDKNGFRGNWSNYPYFDSGVVVLSDMQRGLFIVRPNLTPATPDFTMDVILAIQYACQGSDAVFAVNVGSVHGFSDAVTLSAMSAPPGAAVSFSPNPVSPGGSSTMTVSTAGLSGTVGITVTGTGSSGSHDDLVTLDISLGTVGPPSLVTPEDGATAQSTRSTFSWNPVGVDLVFTIVSTTYRYTTAGM